MDIVTLALAKKGAKQYTDTVVGNLPKGIVYKGSVGYYSDLPNNAEIGDCYTVTYEGSTGTTPSGAEYVWGVNTETSQEEWVRFGKDYNEATTETAGLMSAADKTKLNGIATAAQVNTIETIKVNNTAQTITDKAVNITVPTQVTDLSDNTNYVKFTDYASGSNAGIIKTYSSRALEMINGEALSAQTKSYSEYGSLNSGAFIGKGTLENVITGKDLTTKSYVDGLVGDVGTLVDAINGEVI